MIFWNYVVGAINAKNVAAIGMVLSVNLLVQYLCGPKIHTNLAGKPLAIIGNTSNKIGEFSLAMIPLSSIKMFFAVFKKECNADLLEHGDNIPDEFCKDTKWHRSLSTHVGMALPNIFLIYFGQNTRQSWLLIAWAPVTRYGASWLEWLSNTGRKSI